MNSVTAEWTRSLVVQEVVEEDSSVDAPDELGDGAGRRKLRKSSFLNSKMSKRRNVDFDAEELLFEKLFPGCADREPDAAPSKDPSFEEF